MAISINSFGWGLTAFKGLDQSCASKVGTAVTHHVSEEKEIDYDLIKPDQSFQTLQQGHKTRSNQTITRCQFSSCAAHFQALLL